MDLDHQAINSIKELAVKAAGDEIIQPEFFPSHRFYLRTGDGTLTIENVPVRPRNYQIHTLEDLAKAIERFTEKATSNQGAVVFCSDHGVVALLDEETERLNRLVMPLTLTDEFVKLQDLREDREGLKQKAFLSLLRIDLARACSPDLVATFRNLKFNKTEDGESVVKPGNEAMSASVKREAMVDGQVIPDGCELQIQVYDQMEAMPKQTVKCAIETDLEELSFTLIPLAGELEEAQRKVDEAIGTKLAALLGDFAPVFCGSCPED